MIGHQRLSLLLLLHIPAWLVKARDFIPLTLGLDFQRVYKEEDLLRGFKLNIADGENPLKSHLFQGTIVTSPSSTSYTKSAVITSVEDVSEMMEIKGSLSVSYGPLISGSGAGSFLQDKVKSKRQISVLYRTRRVAYAKSVDVKTLKAVPGLDKISRDELATKYGSKFIDQILYGAQLDVIYTVEASEDTDFQEIEAELKGKIGVGALSVSFSANFDKTEGYTSSRYSLSIEARASGISFNVPPNPNFDEMNDLIDKFNAKYEDTETQIDIDAGVTAVFSPVAFALSNVAEHLPAQLSIDESARFDDKMEDLQLVFYDALFAKSELQKIRDEQEDLYGVDPRVRGDIFMPYNSAVDDAISELDSKVDECLDFRKLPVREIISSATQVPTSLSEAKMNGLAGLRGEAYISSPVTINSVPFDSFHYIGFALPIKSNSGQLVPWMSGVLRRDTDNSVAASANTPEDLAQLGLSEITSTGHEYFKYGDAIFLQNSAIDFRWLKRIDNGTSISTDDYLSDASAGSEEVKDYKWRLSSRVGDLTASDPKLGQRVKYGDTLFLGDNSNGWLHRGRDSVAGSCGFGMKDSVYGIEGSMFDLIGPELAGVEELSGDTWTIPLIFQILGFSNTWVERFSDSGRADLYWKEDRRDESSVYLIDDNECRSQPCRKGSTVRLDLILGKVMFCPKGSQFVASDCDDIGNIKSVTDTAGNTIHPTPPDDDPCTDGECCANVVAKDFETSRLQWRMRSSTAQANSNELNPDPAHNQCIQLGSMIYLQSVSQQDRWLSVGRRGLALAVGFYPSDDLSISIDTHDEYNNPDSYEWIVRKDAGGMVQQTTVFSALPQKRKASGKRSETVLTLGSTGSQIFLTGSKICGGKIQSPPA